MNNERTYPIVITRVINGDTIQGKVDLGFNVVIEARFRLNGIVAPSLRSELLEVRERAKASKMWLTYRLNKQQVIIKVKETSKFGHYLGTLFIEGSDVNQELLTAGHVVKFNKREKEDEK